MVRHRRRPLRLPNDDLRAEVHRLSAADANNAVRRRSREQTRRASNQAGGRSAEAGSKRPVRSVKAHFQAGYENGGSSYWIPRFFWRIVPARCALPVLRSLFTRAVNGTPGNQTTGNAYRARTIMDNQPLPLATA